MKEFRIMLKKSLLKQIKTNAGNGTEHGEQLTFKKIKLTECH